MQKIMKIRIKISLEIIQELVEILKINIKLQKMKSDLLRKKGQKGLQDPELKHK